MKTAINASNNLKNTLNGTTAGMKTFGSQSSGVGGIISSVASKAAVAVGAFMSIRSAINFGKDVVNTGMEFEQGMANVSAISGATGDELKALSEKAKEMGVPVVFSCVDTGGNISWTNDGGLENPATQNIRGPAGQDGAQGPAGLSAYEAAAEAGYQGTQATFNAALAALPYHGARHLPGGADPISVRTESMEDGAVTADKLAAGSVSVTYNVQLDPALWQGETAPFTQTVSLAGLLGSDTPLVDVQLSGTFSTDRKRLEDYAQLYRAVAEAGALTVYALGRPTVMLPLRILCIRK